MGQSMSFSLTNLPTSPFTSLLSINPNVKSIEFKDAVCLLEIEYKTNHLFIEHFRRPVVIKIDESTPCGMQDSDTGSLEKTARLKLAFEIAPWFIDEDYFEIHVNFSLKKIQHLERHPKKLTEGPFLCWQLVTDIVLKEIKKCPLPSPNPTGVSTPDFIAPASGFKSVYPFIKTASSSGHSYRPAVALIKGKADTFDEKDFLLKKLTAVFFASGRFF
jgi:hypothetical protein